MKFVLFDVPLQRSHCGYDVVPDQGVVLSLGWKVLVSYKSVKQVNGNGRALGMRILDKCE